MADNRGADGSQVTGRALGRGEIFRRMLGALKPGSYLDVGCGHGRFALIAQELGWEVTAVDARTTRFPDAPGITWIQADVRTFDVAGYDCIGIMGLLYHLELAAQLDLLRRCSYATTIVDTHFSVPGARERGHGRDRKGNLIAPAADPILDAVDRREHEELGYRGHIHVERPDKDEDGLRADAGSSWGNRESFWPDRRSLVAMLHDCGYDTVLMEAPPYRRDRAWFLCR